MLVPGSIRSCSTVGPSGRTVEFSTSAVRSSPWRSLVRRPLGVDQAPAGHPNNGPGPARIACASHKNHHAEMHTRPWSLLDFDSVISPSPPNGQGPVPAGFFTWDGAPYGLYLRQSMPAWCRQLDDFFDVRRLNSR